MRKLWYVVYVTTYEGKISFLKDPEFCRGDEVPFKTYIKNDKDDHAFLPWMTQYRETAQAQASLLESIDGIKHSVGAFEVDFSKLIIPIMKKVFNICNDDSPESIFEKLALSIKKPPTHTLGLKNRRGGKNEKLSL